MTDHLTVPFDADRHGNPASYRCVRCKLHWPVGTTPIPCRTKERTP